MKMNNNCILCESTGKNRRFFFEDKPLCDSDYISYLEFLIDDINESITPESANNAFNRLKISLRPEPQNQHDRLFSTKVRRRR